MRPEHHLRVNKLVIALLRSYSTKNKLRAIQPQIFEQIKNSQPELKFTGSYKKNIAIELQNKQNIDMRKNEGIYVEKCKSRSLSLKKKLSTWIYSFSELSEVPRNFSLNFG